MTKREILDIKIQLLREILLNKTEASKILKEYQEKYPELEVPEYKTKSKK